MSGAATRVDTGGPTKAVILAAGRGTRLRPLTDTVPKCMVPIGGKPILEHAICWLERHGVVDLVINLHHLAEAVTDHFGDGRRWGVRISYSPEKELLGTAGAVKQASRLVALDQPFLVWFGDNLSRCRLDLLWSAHRNGNGIATIALHEREDPTQSGIVGLDEQNRITRFLEKPRPEEIFSRWVNAGILVLEPRALAYIPDAGPCDFGRTVIPTLLTAGETITGYRMERGEGPWWIDTPEDLRRVQLLPNPPWNADEPRTSECANVRSS